MKKFKQLNSVLSVVFKYAISTKHRVGYGYFNRRILINIFFICFLYHFQDSFGQNIQKRDSSYFYLKAFEFSNNNNDSLIFYAKKIQQSNNRCQRVDGILYEAKGFYGKIDFKNSRRLAYKAIQQSKIDTKVCDKKNLIDAYGRLFYISKNQDKYDEALEYLTKRKEIIESLKLKDEYYMRNLVNVQMNLANLKIRLGYYDKEDLSILRECYKQLGQIRIKNLKEESRKNLSLLKANVLNSIGDAFVYLNQKDKNIIYLDSASYYYAESYRIVSSLSKPNDNTNALYRMRQVNITFEKKDYELALFYLNRYDSLLRKYPNYMSSYHHIKAIALRHQGKYDSAIYHSQKYLSSFEDKQAFNKFSIYILDNLANIYYSKNIPDSALKYSNLTLEKYKEFEEKKRKTFIKIHADELDDIKRMNEKLIQNSEESNLFEYSIIVMILLSSSILLYIKNKRVKPKEKKKRKDIDGNLRERILRGLSDFELSEIFLESEFTINSLAEYLETNTTYLSTVINNDKKKSFKQYLAELRINYAIQKLKNDRKFIKYSISSIAAEVGYTNASAFARIFKKQTGKTPSEFIKLINLENSAKANK